MRVSISFCFTAIFMSPLLHAETPYCRDLETAPVLVQWEEGQEKLRGALRMSGDTTRSIVVNGTTIELVERGQGRPILFLHPGIGIDPAAAVLAALARGGRLIAPSHPGFGNSQLPKGMTSVDDLSYFYLDLFEQLDLRDTLVIGVGLGGWLAAEIAVKTTERSSHLVMANAVGVKVGDRETRDIVDIWSLMPDQIDALAYFDPKAGKRDYKTLPEAESIVAA